MTEKIYYKDAYVKEFSASVISCTETEGGFDVVLDKTAFFPEEGGQYSDRGYLNDSAVSDVREISGIIHHYTDKALTHGEEVIGKIDFQERYEKMQCHTGEHILSGIIHKLFGLENVGFHLGKDDVTMDISKPLTREELCRVEALANEVIYKNVEVTTEFPSSEELSFLQYRSKLDLKENVRIVNIGEYDSCACCAPHVKYTGEIGVIKILDFAKLRGGIRIHIAAGRRAMREFESLYNNALGVSSLICVPKSEIAEGVKKLLADYNTLKAELSAYKRSVIEKEAETLPKIEGNYLYLNSGASMDELIAYSNVAVKKVSGILVALSGREGAYKYIISSESVDLKSIIGEINKSLLGRGGGKSGMVQGSFSCGLSDIKKYFSQA